MADEADDLDYSDSNVGLAQAQGVRKNISLKLKGKGRGRGRRGGKVRRGSKKTAGGTEDDTEETNEMDEISTEKQLPNGVFPSSAKLIRDDHNMQKIVDSNLDDVISKLETPAFSPMDRTFPEPLHQNKKLRWDHKVNLIGEKVMDPLIHCCEQCSLPILNYGRMIPCKHVFCYDCTKKADKCPKCDDKIQRIESSALGTVFMCTFGGTRHSPGACGRTYLSQRDLQAHINHRHIKPPSTVVTVSAPSHSVTVSTAPSVTTTHMPITRDPRDPRGHLQVDVSHQAMIVGHLQHPTDHREAVDHSRNAVIPLGSPAGQSRPYPHSPASYPSTIPVSSARPNLITVPIQDDGAAHAASAAVAAAVHMHPQTHVPAYAPNTVAPPHPIPAIQHPGTAYTPHAYVHPTSSPAYSQAPPITTPTFSQPPPPVHHQPPLLQPGTSGGGPIYSTPPPPVHHQPPATYTPPRAPAPRPPMHPPAPQHHHDGTATYHPQWVAPGSNVPPPPTRASLPPRPITAPPPNAPNQSVGLLQTPRVPADPAYRQPYYQ